MAGFHELRVLLNDSVILHSGEEKARGNLNNVHKYWVAGNEGERARLLSGAQ